MGLRRDAVLLGLCACTRSAGATATAIPPSAALPPDVKGATLVVQSDAGSSPATGPVELVARSFPLPGAIGPVSVDYIVCDPAHARVWVPVGDTGSADVFDIARGTFTRVDGFRSAERQAHGTKRMAGPSAATVGDGFVYIGDRATSEVCPIDEKTLERGSCLRLPTATDGVAYVASAKEVWVTTPRDHSLTVLDASNPNVLRAKLVIKTDGDPEGYAVDAAHGFFYTNLEDKNRTLRVDIKTHAIKTSWIAGCNADGPRGLAVDEAYNLVLVACTDGVRVLDGAHEGALRGTLDTGAGVDNIDYHDASRQLVVAAGKASRLTVAHLSETGELSVLATGTTAQGARNPVADGEGALFVVDPGAARLLRFSFPTPH